ncbi:MAG: tRNA epoxyqueuosine(34) reductase QueG, partial [Acidimicrobiia bacterium]
TGPVLERELAAGAGLGSVGKNTTLLSAEIGSWFLLGELFLTLDLEPDVPGSDLCGTCAQCLEACPTGALPEPYRLDSRLCISYWTIEHRGAIPIDVRPLLGEWVFGCDICQEVCPINTDLVPADHAEFQLPNGRASLDLAGLLGLEREEYTEIFRGSPMKRAKLEGLQRNAALAMGNSASPKYTEPLIGALVQGATLVRQHAAWALGRIGCGKALEALREALNSEPEPEVRAEIQAALQDSGVKTR